jgi:hypothetical protein
MAIKLDELGKLGKLGKKHLKIAGGVAVLVTGAVSVAMASSPCLI